MNDNITSGIISGLVVTLFIVVFRNFWTKTVIPWFENRVYKDIRIEGTWFTISPTIEGERPETVTLNRHGHEISGNIICNSGPDEGLMYNVNGSFRNMILTLFYECVDQRKLDRGTITLKCVRNGERLSGKIANYDDDTDAILSHPVLWFRDKKDQEQVLIDVREKDAMIDNLRSQSESLEEETRKLTEHGQEIEAEEFDIKDSTTDEDKN